MQIIPESELIINNDGSIFHLHLHPEDIADDILIVGDPGRVETVASLFDKTEIRKSNREFATATGYYNGKRISVLSTGIGPDNIDIVMTELDALANIDFRTRTPKSQHKQLRIIRMGTSGSLDPELALGSFAVSEKSIGIDGLLHFYAHSSKIRDTELEEAFIRHCEWISDAPRPYAVSADPELVSRLCKNASVTKGITITAGGFYGPQGREVRLPGAMPGINSKLRDFRYKNRKIANYEMESAPIAGLSALLGHKAATICMIVAGRNTGEALTDYRKKMKEMILHTLNSIISLP